ncbi:MAG: hypothetical protein ACFFD3_07060 [Candidatus Thorarchaeota archaeon]
MSEKVPNIPGLKTLRSKFSAIRSTRIKKIAIYSTPAPHAILAAAVLCRAALRANILFHVKFIEPLESVGVVPRTLPKESDTLQVYIDITFYGKEFPDNERIVAIGSSSYPDFVSIEVKRDYPIALEAYTLAKEVLKISNEELSLAAAGSILEGLTNKPSNEILSVSTKSNLISSRKGFKIPGTNFLPLDEVFLNSIHPFISNLSGNPASCQKLINDADIPIDKWSRPLSKLSNKEARSLSSALIPLLSSNSVPDVFGSDYETLTESPESPMRYISSLSALGQTMWSLKTPSIFLGVSIGDRARLLADLIERYKNHCKATINGTQKLSSILNEDDTKISKENHIFTTSAIAEIPEAIAPDCSRIIMESDLGTDTTFLLLRTAESIFITWKKQLPSVKVMAALLSKKIALVSASSNSIRVMENSEKGVAKVIGALTSDILRS